MGECKNRGRFGSRKDAKLAKEKVERVIGSSEDAKLATAMGEGGNRDGINFLTTGWDFPFWLAQSFLRPVK